MIISNVYELPKVAEDRVSHGTAILGQDIVTDDYKALINPDTGKLYKIVSNQYALTRNEDIDSACDKAVESFYQGPVTKNVTVYDDGARVKWNYDFRGTEYEVDKLNRQKGDIICPTLNVYNSYDTSWKYDFVFGALRLACLNGMVTNETIFRITKKHLGESMDYERIAQFMMSGLNDFSKLVDQWKSWNHTNTSPEVYERIINGMELGKKEQETIGNEVEIASAVILEEIKLKTLSYWLFFNVVTQFITHKVQSELRKRVLQQRASQMFYK